MHAHGHSWVNSTTGYQRSLGQGILPLGQNRSCLMKGFGFEREFGQGPSSQARETINFPKAQNPHALLSVECSRGTRATHTFWPVFMQSLSHNSNKMKRWSTSKYWRKTLYTWSNMYCTSMFADRTINHNNQTQYSNSNTVSSATSSKLENNYQRGKELALSPFTVVWGGIGPRSVISTFVTGTSVVWLFVCVCVFGTK